MNLHNGEPRTTEQQNNSHAFTFLALPYWRCLAARATAIAAARHRCTRDLHTRNHHARFGWKRMLPCVRTTAERSTFLRDVRVGARARQFLEPASCAGQETPTDVHVTPLP